MESVDCDNVDAMNQSLRRLEAEYRRHDTLWGRAMATVFSAVAFTAGTLGLFLYANYWHPAWADNAEGVALLVASAAVEALLILFVLLLQSSCAVDGSTVAFVDHLFPEDEPGRGQAAAERGGA